MSTLPYQSLPALFIATCANPEFPGCFMRAGSGWREYSRETLLATVKGLVSAFRHFGISRDSCLGIIAPSSPEWVMADIAVQICGGYTVPLFPNIAEENFLFQCEEANIKNLLIATPGALDAELQAHLPQFENVFRLVAGENRLENETLWSTLLEYGKQNPIAEEEFQKLVENVQSDDVFSILYTSGSTGKPKGVALTHRNMISQFLPLKGRLSELTPGTSTLSVLPIAHVFERAVTYYYFFIGAKIYFGGDPKQLATLLKEVQPSVMTVVPRLLERIYEKILKLSRTAPYPKRFFLKRAVRYAQIADPLAPKSITGKICEKLVFKQIRESLGSNFKYLISGSSALNKNICRFFLNLGIPVCEGYGMTETSPVLCINTDELNRPGSVGKPLECLDLKLSDEGEILVRGENVFNGYHNLGEENRNFFTEDGYFRTGDSGYFGTNGGLYLTGRIKEMLKTSTGKYVSPVPIEEDLCHNPLISAACVVANNRKFVSAILFLQPEAARQMLDIDGEKFSMERAVKSRSINESIAKTIDKTNHHLNYWEQIRKWILLPDIPDVNNGLLTPTLKLRRKEVEKQFAEQIEMLYEVND